PEILDGRVKTLHPKIHGGLLARRDLPDHVRQLEEHEITPIDILVSNLYPFEETVSAPGATDETIVENIDIGGPAMVRAAAKNFATVTVVTDPGDYESVLTALKGGEAALDFRRSLAAKAYAHVSTYDSLVSEFLRTAPDSVAAFPEELSIGLRLAKTPKYGENPQQRAAAYRRLRAGAPESGLLDAEFISGDDLSFNNYLDADAAWQAAQLFTEPAVAIVKHMVPCGLATRAELVDAYAAALAGDPVSAYGGIVALNRTVDLATAQQLRRIKLDIIIAPGYDDDAREVLLRKKGTRILSLANRAAGTLRTNAFDLRPIGGGLLVQTPDIYPDDESTWKVVTEVQPTDGQRQDLAFAWQAARMVKSNAIVFARDLAIVGLGAGQPNRLESVAIAARKAGEAANGAAMASDAYFPFADGIEQGIAAGVTAVIQPGGSIRDEDVIAAANRAGITMIFTGTRHFRH
ncbi:MAG TPA: bifunctional phosphoribosylaminoimidazolecarboxamide formyltransferase/IMP cyclohydrolase, partial [Thermomicrobiales bacterium]|nr:bifunctional phosphoribosylaminoimidazolecarboxamide formyltransferase/IMP cyclohydrolase [Thermomicrobiales bacterium]